MNEKTNEKTNKFTDSKKLNVSVVINRRWE